MTVILLVVSVPLAPFSTTQRLVPSDHKDAPWNVRFGATALDRIVRLVVVRLLKVMPPNPPLIPAPVVIANCPLPAGSIPACFVPFAEVVPDHRMTKLLAIVIAPT